MLKMPVIKLYDLAEVVVEETCKKLNIKRNEVDLQITGLRSGERKFEELMTKEEAESAFNLGDMYAVLPSLYLNELQEFYENHERAEIKSYNSSNKDILSKEEVRNLLKEEGLV